MPLHPANAVLPRVPWVKPARKTVGARDLRCDRASGEMRAYVRAFSAPLIPIAVLGGVCLFAASWAAG